MPAHVSFAVLACRGSGDFVFDEDRVRGPSLTSLHLTYSVHEYNAFFISCVRWTPMRGAPLRHDEALGEPSFSQLD